MLLFKEIYSRLRLFVIPIKEIDESIPKDGNILDLGCGNGGLSLAIAKLSRDRRVIGWDFNERRIRNAKILLKGKTKLSFAFKDLTKNKLPKISGAIASDFLHHLSQSDQEIVINHVYRALKKSGIFVIKEIDKSDIIRSVLSGLWDKLLYPKDKIHYRSKREWKKFLTRVGFKVKIRSAVLWFPGSTTLFICSK